MTGTFDSGYAVWYFFRVLFISLIFVFLISGLDDLFLDLVYYVRALFRRLFRRKLIKPLTREQLISTPEKPIALMIPAWDESSIIQHMLLNTAGAIDYKNFVIFVGTYPNDEATAMEVGKAREVYPNIEMIVTPADGPTNKADCLNWIYQGVRLYEKEHGIRFEAFVMHDAEDLVHPLWLRLVNHLVPRVDFIQLPVFPLEASWYNLVNGVYKNEFAESHTKDMRAREVLTHSLPSAGVGTALSRQTLEWMAEQRNNQVFDIKSLTEDYAFGILLNKMPGRKIFLQQWVEYRQKRKSFFSGKEKEVTVRQPMATREHFPHTFAAAVRQKSRWILGISLQGWGAGWTRSLGDNYMLFRDRKTLLTNLAVVLGYAVVLYWAGVLLYNNMNPEAKVPPLIAADEPYFVLGAIVLGLLAWRIINRMVATARIYGVFHGFLSVPCLLVGNFLNFCATVLAIKRYIASRIRGQVPAWGKTEHAWPSEEQLRMYHRRLGDLLMERRMITASQLEEALGLQKENGGKLGDILVKMGILWEEDVVRVLAVQEKSLSVEIDPYTHPELRDLVPLALAREHRVYPVEMKGDTLILARQAGEEGLTEQEMGALLGRDVAFRLTTAADIDFALERGYGSLASVSEPANRIGQRLLRKGVLTHESLTEALRRQKRSNERLGDILVSMKLLTTAQLEQHLKEIEP